MIFIITSIINLNNINVIDNIDFNIIIIKKFITFIIIIHLLVPPSPVSSLYSPSSSYD